MLQVNMHEAKTQLHQLVELAEKGERVVITRGGTPVVELVRLDPTHVNRRGGQWKGTARISGDFDAPLPGLEERFGG
jgi:prevent-host-death family protein